MRLLAFTIVAVLVLSGCHLLHRKKKVTPPNLPTSAPAPMIEQTANPISVPVAPPMPVKQGELPLAYIVESGGLVRVADKETGRTIAQGAARPGGIVSVDERAGVHIGGELIVSGPLATGRVYEIYLENQGENMMQQQQILPGFQPRNR